MKQIMNGFIGILFLAGAAKIGAMETIAPPIQRSPQIRIQPIEDTEPPTAPQGLSARCGTSIQLAWSPSSDAVTGLIGYRVYRDGERLAQVEGTNFEDTGAKPAVTYRYQVTAIDGVGNESRMSNSVAAELPMEASQRALEAYSYPNPAVGGVPPVIRATVKDVDQLQVRIYDLSGRLVESGDLRPASLEPDGRIAYEFGWSGSIVSGTYFGVVTGNSGGTVLHSRVRISVVR